MNVLASRQDLDLFHYEMECIIRMFLPGEQVRFFDQQPEEEPIHIRVTGEGGRCAVTLETGDFSQCLEEDCGGSDKDRERAVCRLLFRLLQSRTGKTFAWGTLTGVRPVKLVRRLREQGMGEAEIEERLGRDYLTSPEKVRLCLNTDQNQRDILDSAAPEDCSLYVSIPFCPSRCSYCSFVSHSVEKSRALVPEYLEKLYEELAVTGELLREKGLRLRTVYVGGGTPTVLDAGQLRGLMDVLRARFPMDACQEFTVEAGRPDTIDREKLEILANAGVERISINTQSMSDAVLRAVGRNHTKDQFLRAFMTAKEFDFTVNVDLIAGLEGETADSFCTSLDQVVALGPQNITVHTLTLKRASTLYGEKNLQLPGDIPVRDMVDYAHRTLAAAGYAPYYLYRQKNTVDSLENVGYAKGDSRCAYNIFIMDETHTILSAGGGGVSKIVRGEQDIRRIFNYKYPYEYVQRFPQVLARKQALRELL